MESPWCLWEGCYRKHNDRRIWRHRTELVDRKLVIQGYDQLTTKVFARKCRTKINQPHDQPNCLAHIFWSIGCKMVVRPLWPTYGRQNRWSGHALRPQWVQPTQHINSYDQPMTVEISDLVMSYDHTDYNQHTTNISGAYTTNAMLIWPITRPIFVLLTNSMATFQPTLQPHYQIHSGTTNHTATILENNIQTLSYNQFYHQYVTTICYLFL